MSHLNLWKCLRNIFVKNTNTAVEHPSRIYIDPSTVKKISKNMYAADNVNAVVYKGSRTVTVAVGYSLSGNRTLKWEVRLMEGNYEEGVWEAYPAGAVTADEHDFIAENIRTGGFDG